MKFLLAKLCVFSYYSSFLIDRDTNYIRRGSNVCCAWSNRNFVIRDPILHIPTDQGCSYPGDVGEQDIRENSNPGNFLTSLKNTTTGLLAPGLALALTLTLTLSIPMSHTYTAAAELGTLK